jgi:hypothetical protein
MSDVPVKNLIIAKSIAIVFIVAEIVLVQYLTTKADRWFENE